MSQDTPEADVTRSVSEDRRLVELGIHPDGDPIDRMAILRHRKEELKLRVEAEYAAILAERAVAKRIDTPSES